VFYTKQILGILGIEHTHEQAQQIADNSFGKPTQTLSKTIDRSKYWSGKAHMMIDDLMVKYKVDYGYE
jgi:hypothetical protein